MSLETIYENHEATAIALIASRETHFKALKKGLESVILFSSILDKSEKSCGKREGIIEYTQRGKIVEQQPFNDEDVNYMAAVTNGIYKDLCSTVVERENGELIRVDTPKIREQADEIVDRVKHNT